MITRPLDLASRLRSPPPSFDALFYVNVGLLGMFFMLFGSPFVLAPGLGVDFRLPAAAGANANARTPTHVISVLATGQIFTAHGVRKEPITRRVGALTAAAEGCAPAEPTASVAVTSTTVANQARRFMASTSLQR